MDILNDLKTGDIQACFRQIYDDDIDLNAPVIDGQYPLHVVCDAAHASYKHEFECLAYDLLRHRSDVNVRDQQGRTPLHYAVLYGFHRFVELFVYFKADLTVKDNAGNTVLHEAAKGGDLITLALLLKLVHKTDKALLDAKNDKKKRFNDLFKKNEQILLYNRFKALKNISTPRNPDRLTESISKADKSTESFGPIFYAMIAMDDHQMVSRFLATKQCCLNRFELKQLIRDTDAVLGISIKMGKVLRGLIKYRRIPDRNKFLLHFSIDQTYEQNILGAAERRLVRLLGFSSSSVPHDRFTILNYAITLYSEEEVEVILKSSRRFSTSKIPLNHIDTKALVKFYPRLAEKYCQHIGNSVIKDLSTDDSCPICKEPYAVGDVCYKLPCKHQFHEECLYAWKYIQHICPLCRKSISLPPRQPEIYY